jgi:CO/xanthine dehydrogenase Mo-binding subunit
MLDSQVRKREIAASLSIGATAAGECLRRARRAGLSWPLPIIAPDGVRAQVEGCILQTISRTLFEEMKFDTKLVTSTDWVTYPILTIPDAPALDIALIDRPSEPPMGVGEASASPVAAAIANAVFDATGVRLRRVPFTPEHVKQALETAPPRAG